MHNELADPPPPAESISVRVASAATNVGYPCYSGGHRISLGVRMKLFIATLLLLFQLQPLVGSAACLLSSDRPSQSECEMPEQRTAAPASVLQSGFAGQGCALALACAPSTTLGVPSLSVRKISIVPLHSAAASSAAVTLTSVASLPPFHPPKA